MAEYRLFYRSLLQKRPINFKEPTNHSSHIWRGVHGSNMSETYKTEIYLGLFYGMDRALLRKDTVGGLGSGEGMRATCLRPRRQSQTAQNPLVRDLVVSFIGLFCKRDL